MITKTEVNFVKWATTMDDDPVGYEAIVESHKDLTIEDEVGFEKDGIQYEGVIVSTSEETSKVVCYILNHNNIS